MPIPDYQTLMLPLLRASAAGETRVADVEDRIADVFALSQEERGALLPDGRQRILQNRIRWAKFYLTKAGLLDTPGRGRFVASEAGRAFLNTNPARLNNQVLLEFDSFKDFMRPDSEVSDSKAIEHPAAKTIATAEKTPEEQIDVSFESLVSALQADLIARVLQNSFQFFEGLIVDLLVAMGYGGSYQNAAARLGRSGDGGVDGVINEDRLGLDQVYLQAKRYAAGNTVGRPEVQNFVGSLVGLHASKGVFVTTSKFSTQATEYVDTLPQRIVLIDGQRLADLMIEHNVGVRTTRSLHFKHIDEDFFSESD